MKKVFLVLTCILIYNCILSQTRDSAVNFEIQKRLLTKSKWQKAAGWTILSTGAAVALFTGYFLIKSASDPDLIDRPIFTTVFAGSIAYTLISIPLLHAGAKNKKRAAEIGVGNSKRFMPQLNSFTLKSQSVISLKVHI